MLTQYHGGHPLLLVQAVDLSREMTDLFLKLRFSTASGKELQPNRASQNSRPEEPE
jgi:hypothetical protein